ncbi:MAG TPA: class I SAM-dependent methyltransferase [Thermoanaerobaculia bacterium]|nr:class I SAM-dependent methyltransferase [Thermoanaerobaculia bacterium]
MADSLGEARRMLRENGPLFVLRFACSRLLSYVDLWRKLRRMPRSAGAAEARELVSFMVDRPGGAAQIVYSMQRKTEILGLLEEVRAAAPRVVVEIGTASGGTLFLFSRMAAPDALLVSLDLPGGPFGGGYASWRIPLYRSFAVERQQILLLRGDSQSAELRERLQASLQGRPIDFLFIDGDHRYAGVRADFAAYAPLVRPGGLIAFHDILPDARQPGMEVSRFWREVSQRFPAREFIEQPDEAGYGIGLLTLPPSAPNEAE